jgi:hypothetical protein
MESIWECYLNIYELETSLDNGLKGEANEYLCGCDNL